MSFDPRRISDPEYFSENRLPAHSDHRWYRDASEVALGESSFEQNLNGVWKFHYAKNPDGVIQGFQSADYDCSDWDDIRVPAHIQLEGYDRPQYVNTQYPWDGHETVELGKAPTRFNPVGSYVTTFEVDEPLAVGERLSVSFKGAESAIAVWLNGDYIGYATDTFTPSEFDVTEAARPGSNKLAVEVFKWTAQSWMEDQDFYRFSGIFRDVVLYRRPTAHVEDLRVTTDLSDLDEAVVTVTVALSGEGSVAASLDGVGELEPAGDGVFTIRVKDPHLWSAEDPYLYDLTVVVHGGAGEVTEVVPQRLGLRRFAIEDGVLKINGKRVVFKGVNRHEFGLQGRVMSREQTEADIRLVKAGGLNAIRTSHYPNNSFFYELADEYGLYVIDEMNLESHGTWDPVRDGVWPVEAAIPGNHPEWRGALLDRAANMLQRDKNHPSVVMWSCGNEAFGGSNIFAVSEYFREVDNRPVHYEGVMWDQLFPGTSDVVSHMYTPAAEVEAYLREHRDKPFIMCEYAHAMGNSFGAVDRYMDLAYREPLFQGGFIWDFADQAIALRDRYGREYFGYGGDCGESPHDGDFSGNGILFADHTPTPRMQEVKYVYQGFKISVTRDSFSVENRLLFTPSSAYDCVVTLGRDGRTLQSAVVVTDVAPGETAQFALPFALPEAAGEYTVDVSFRQREATKWACAGHEVASEQEVFSVGTPTAVTVTGPAPEVIMGIHNVGVRGPHFSAIFSRLHGGLLSYRYGMTSDGGRELLKAVPKPNFWHAPTANERGWDAPFTDGDWLLASRYARVARSADSPAVEVQEDSVRVSYTYLLPTRPQSECSVAYRVFGTGRIEVTVSATPGASLPDLPEFGMMFIADADLHNLRYLGEGPEESYVDRRGGARLGIYDRDVADMLTPYLHPQESGSRTGVRWATVTDDRGRGLRFDSAGADGGMEFSALPWTPFEIENAAHPNELPPILHTVLRPALARRGVGGDDSWGSRPHEEYMLPSGQERVFTFGFQGLL